MTTGKRKLPNIKITQYLISLVKENENWKLDLNDEFGEEIVQKLLDGKTAYELMLEYDLEYPRIKTYLMKACNMNPKFGDKIIELHKVLKDTPEWEQYVSEDTEKIVKYVFKTQSIDDAIKHFDMLYTTVRSHLLRALDRVSNKKTDFKRYGKSEQAQELFDLMDNTPEWEKYVTDNEAFLAKKFKEVKNFYKLGRILNLSPSNIAGTLYGTTQKIGVIGKIKQQIPQTERRDIDKRKEKEK